MGSDSVMKGSAPAISKDFGKKKRPNRLAKLKQCKLDARREQWLSHAKNKASKEESNGGGGSLPLSLHLSEEGNHSLANSEMSTKGNENEGSSVHDSDVEFVVNSATSSEMGINDSSNGRPGSSCGSSSSLSGCYSGNVSDGEEDDCLDDWEAVADALIAEEKHSNSDAKQGTPVGSLIPPETPNEGSGESAPVGAIKRAWRPDDAFRPPSFPNLLKLNIFPVCAERQRRGAVTWPYHSIVSQPSSCPVCYEDLDVTDSSFHPCSCGFHICLFCHKRILEVDGRCPGCRKHYVITSGDTGRNGEFPQWQFAGSRNTVTSS